MRDFSSGGRLRSAIVAASLATSACAVGARRDVMTRPDEGARAPAPATPTSAPVGTASGPAQPPYFAPGSAPFSQYGRLSRATCEAELARRSVAYVRGAETPFVLAPVRLRGPLNGVLIHSGLPASKRDTSAYEIFDCRLVLALHDFAGLLAWRGVVEMIHMSAYRPQAENGCTARYVGKQHCAALAVDVGLFKRRDGVVLDVEKDFHGRIGQETCGGAATPTPPSPAANELWSWVCEATRRSLFNVILTPNYNAQHRNHFHLEVLPDAEWMMVK